jgi:predicted RNA-binding protein associated with RNAse of E/G family
VKESTYDSENIFFAEDLVLDIIDFYISSAVFADQDFVTLLNLKGNIVTRVILLACSQGNDFGFLGLFLG